MNTNKKGLRLIPTNLPGHFTYEPPPEGLKLTSASDEELRHYGLPHRPDPKKFPEAARLWVRAMSSVKKFVTPELVIRPNIVCGNGGLGDATSTAPNWSGLTVSKPGAFDQLWGTWTIPSVTVPPGAGSVAVPGGSSFGDYSWFPYSSSLWVGLYDPAIGSLFQAGTEQNATLTFGLGGDPSLGLVTTSYNAWYQWFPGCNVQINGFSVAPGQEVLVAVGPQYGPDVEETSNEPGLVYMYNFATNVAITPIVVPAPTNPCGTPNTITPPLPGIPSTQAVWILERPTLIINGVSALSALADFGTASFSGGGALVKDVNAVTVGLNDQGILLNMIANDGVTVLCTATETPGVQGVQFVFTGGPAA